MIQFVVYCTNNEVLRYNDVTFTVRHIWSLLLDDTYHHWQC